MVLGQLIETVGAPTADIAPQMHGSMIRIAGFPQISTVALPIGNALAVGWWAMGGSEQMCMSPATLAGIPPISTVGAPGPTIVPPWFVTSPTRAAAGMMLVG